MKESNLAELIKRMAPKLNDGQYVFSTTNDMSLVDRKDTICEFKEEEGTTIVIEKKMADQLNLSYDYVASWITLMVHSSLHAIGLTSAFSAELTQNNISCNVIAGYYHDHIFVSEKDAEKAMEVLTQLTNK